MDRPPPGLRSKGEPTTCLEPTQRRQLRVLRFAAMIARLIPILMTLLLLLAGCDRNVQPYVPGEKPQQPDLSKIFPAGAEKAASREGPGAMGGRGAAPVAATPAAATRRPIVGEVRIAPELAENAPNGGVLFVIARRGEAGPPTAVKRIASPSFPVEFSIGPEDRMIQSVPFDGPFQVTARLDADGDAMTREPGDLSGNAPERVTPGVEGLSITLDQVQ